MTSLSTDTSICWWWAYYPGWINNMLAEHREQTLKPVMSYLLLIQSLMLSWLLSDVENLISAGWCNVVANHKLVASSRCEFAICPPYRRQPCATNYLPIAIYAYSSTVFTMKPSPCALSIIHWLVGMIFASRLGYRQQADLTCAYCRVITNEPKRALLFYYQRVIDNSEQSCLSLNNIKQLLWYNFRWSN